MLWLVSVLTIKIFPDCVVGLCSYCQNISRILWLLSVLTLKIFLECCGWSLFLLSGYFYNAMVGLCSY